MTSRGDQAPQDPPGPDADGAVTYAFGDADAQLFGLARLELGPGADATTARAGGHAVLFAGRQAVAARAAGDVLVERTGDWDRVKVAGVRTEERARLQCWDVRFDGDDGADGFALRFEALSPPAALSADAPAAVAGGAPGYEQLCRVFGVATVGGQDHAIDCLGQRGHASRATDARRVALVRSVSAWLDDELALSVCSIRPRKAKSHADEVIAASLFTSLDEDGTVAAIAIEEARLSTTTDREGRVLRAGIEMFLDEDDPGSRAAGAVLCGTSLDLGARRLDCAFFAWRMDGHTGVGRYDVLHHLP